MKLPDRDRYSRLRIDIFEIAPLNGGGSRNVRTSGGDERVAMVPLAAAVRQYIRAANAHTLRICMRIHGP